MALGLALIMAAKGCYDRWQSRAARKVAIEEFGIIDPERQKRLMTRRIK
jgi:hypothetical protein